MSDNDLTATAKVRVTLEVTLSQPFGNWRLEEIVARSKKDVSAKMQQVITKSKTGGVQLLSIDDVAVTVHEKK